MSQSKSKISTVNIVVIALLLVICAMAVGYAAFATQLTINGSAEIVSGQWNVQITKIEATTIEGTAVAGTPTNTATTATFDAQLYKPGDSVTYTVTVENNGTIDAVLDSSTFTEQTNGSPAIIYETTNPASELPASGSTTFTVTATFDPNATAEPEVKTKTITGIIEYSQKPDAAA